MPAVRIAVNATILDDKPTGLGTYSINVINELSKLVRVHVITPYAAPFQKNTNIEIIMAPEIVQPKNRKTGAVARLLWLNLFLPLTLRKKKIDFFVSLAQHGLFFSSIPQIITVHDIIPIRFPSQYILQNLYYRFFLPLLIQRAKVVNTISEFTKKEIIGYYGTAAEKVLVSGNGFNPLTDRVSEGRERGDYILMVGATYGHKNIHRVIEAYAGSAVLQRYGLKVVGGETSYARFLRSLSGKLGIQEKVEFIDYAGTESLADLYGRALIFVFPSLYEGFGMPPLEAMQAETPVVASDIVPVREVCENAVLYFDPESVEDIREKIELACRDEGLRSDLVKRGVEQVKKHSWSKVAEKIYNVILRYQNK